jgi:hypothetical protein
MNIMESAVFMILYTLLFMPIYDLRRPPTKITTVMSEYSELIIAVRGADVNLTDSKMLPESTMCVR